MDLPADRLRVVSRVRNSIETPLTSVVLAALSAALTGCASGTKRDTLPTDGPTMAEIYRQHMAATGQQGPAMQGRAELRPNGPDATPSAYHRRVGTDINERFTRLPNPDLVMYVAPHLSPNGRYPVPGYSTVFPMYETVEYALPGEVPWRGDAHVTSVPPAATAAASTPYTSLISKRAQ